MILMKLIKLEFDTSSALERLADIHVLLKNMYDPHEAHQARI